ncbi:MAG: glycosyltransferase family 2 protein [Hyphomonas sp.]
MTSVDIVVPCYNYAHYLNACIETIVSQRDVSVRVLIIDDCSPDNTPEVASHLAASDPRITYVRNENNLGLIGTANRGVMEWANSDYVVLLSADDQLTPGALSRACQLLDAHPEMSMCYGMALMMWDDGAPLAPDDPLNAETRIIPGKDFIRRIFEHGNAVPTPTAVMRTSVQRAIGGYNSLLKHTSDADTWMRAGAVGSIGVIDAVQGLYRWHAQNMSAAYQRRPIGDRREMVQTGLEFIRLFGDRVPEAKEWQKQMERRLAMEALHIARDSFRKPGDDTWSDSLTFAEDHLPGIMLKSEWWALKARQVIGRSRMHALARLRARLRSGADTPDTHGKMWYDHGMQIGFWPG